jgi:hypothetical protein
LWTNREAKRGGQSKEILQAGKRWNKLQWVHKMKKAKKTEDPPDLDHRVLKQHGCSNTKIPLELVINEEGRNE